MSGGVRYEIAIGGTPRTYRDAWAAATNLKMKQKRRHLPGKTVARDRPSSGGETLCSAADMFDGNPGSRGAHPWCGMPDMIAALGLPDAGPSAEPWPRMCVARKPKRVQGFFNKAAN